MIYALFALFSLNIIFGKIITKKFFNPISIYSIIWGSVIFLYQFRISRLQKELDSETIKLFLLSTLFFFICFIITYCFKISKKNYCIKKENYIIQQKKIDTLFIIWIIIEIFEIVYSKGIPLIWIVTGSSKTYMDFGVPTLHGLMNSVGLVIIMLAFYDILNNSGSKNKKKNYLIIFSCLSFYLSLITRQVIVSAAIQMVIIFVFFKKNIPWKKIGIIAILGIIGFGIIGNLRTGYKAFLEVSLIDSQINPLFIGIYWVYMYLTMTVANVNNAVILEINHYGGLFPVFKQFIPTVISDAIYKNSTFIIPDYLVTRAYNVSGYFINFYVGMGNIGVYIIACIYGLLGGILMKKMQKNYTEKNILYFSVYMQIIILSFFSNHLLYLPSGFQFIVIYFIFKYSIKTK